MNDALQPETIKQLRHVIHGSDRVLAVGNRTKTPLSDGTDATLVSLAKLSGFLQYEPSEFTFTAQAGTPVAEVSAVLAEKGQYLPFDPMLCDQGATLGGTVAAGMSGPGRQRYGGIRDFLLGVQFISSDGAVINSGGKVVKNAAGFDIPKLLVGSLGRLGVMTELTFKVFPRPSATKTLRVACGSHQTALQRIDRAANSRWELDAIDYVPGDGLFVRLCGPTDANDALAGEIKSEWVGEVSDVDADAAESFWHAVCELQPRSEATSLAKVPISPEPFLALQALSDSRQDIRTHLSVAGAVAWVWLENEESLAAVDQHLATSNHCALAVIGNEHKNKWIGTRTTSEMEQRIHQAMDPAGKFPSLQAF